MDLDVLSDILSDIKKTSLDGGKSLSEELAGKKYLKFLREEKNMNLDEMEGILTEKGNVQIASCAGSGKTTSLVHKIIYDWITGELGTDNSLPRVWLCTFLHKGADDLRDSMAKANKEYAEYAQRRNIKYMYCVPSKHTISTMHSEFLYVVQSIEGKIDLIGDLENRRLLAQTLKENGIKYTGRSERSNVVDDFITALSYTRNRTDDSRYDVPLYQSLKLKPSSIRRVLDGWKKKRIEAGKYDFEDLQEKIYTECKAGNKEYVETVSNRFDYMYIDEFQDTSQIQYEVLKFYALHVKKILVIGDDDQTIYTWRGSSGNIIRETFIEDFKPAKKQLSVNYRCPANILNPIIQSITKNKKRIPKSIKAYKNGGEFRVEARSNYMEMAGYVVDSVKNDLQNGMEGIAILCRTNTDAILPALELIKSGLDIQVSGEKMTLNTRIGRSVLGVFKLFLERGSKDILNCLKLYAPKEQANAEAIIGICRNHNQTIWQLNSEDLVNSESVLYYAIAKWIKWYNTMEERDCLLAILDDYINNAFESRNQKRSQYNEELKGVFTAIKDIVIESEYSEVCDIYDEVVILYDKLMDAVKDKNIKSKKPVEVATVHEYKGAEVDSVYVWNDTQGMFPHIKGGEVVQEDTIEEERRIHYIACTRAKKKMCIMTIAGCRGDFLNEMALERKRSYTL